jgi:hypothetical protein
VTSLHDLFQTGPFPTVPTPPTLTADFYALPFPNDLRKQADGKIDFSLYPRVGGLTDTYTDIFASDLVGFGTNAAVYFRFDGPIDPATLPSDAPASVADGATAFIVDVTPGSTTFGKRSPVLAHFSPARYDFIGPNWVALLPFPGIVLREKTTYAAVLTNGLKGMDGLPVRRAAALDSVLTGQTDNNPRIAQAESAYAPFTDWLKSQGDLGTHVVNVAVFTTRDVTSVMAHLRTAVYSTAAPVLTGLTDGGPGLGGVDHVYTGTFQSPNFQVGDPPYQTQGGAIQYGADGTPTVQRIESLRVAMTIPEGTMPTGGWPVVIYAHGTGGDYESFITDGSGAAAALVKDAGGSTIAELAMISIDQVLHGPRDPTGSNPDLTFFNFQNLRAGHDNPKQGALDDYQLVRLVKAIDVAQAPGTNKPIKFDATKIYFKGHSQGSLTGPLFLSAEPEVKAVVLSGAGGVLIYTLLNKTQPVNIPQLLGAVLADPVDQYHPFLNLLQAYMEDSDPVNYAHLLMREPPDGFQPKSVYQSLGIVDHYTPVPNIKALALALGVQPVNPMLAPIENLDLVGQSWGTAPVTGNATSNGATATGVLLEYTAPAGDDGHFVVFDVPAATAQSNRFLATHAATGKATLAAP